MSATASDAGTDRVPGERPQDVNGLARAVLAATPGALASVIHTTSADAASRRPTEGEWSALEVMRHLFEVEVLLRERVEAIVAGDGGPIARPSSPRPPTPSSVPALLEAWRDRRRENLAWLVGLGAEQLGRSGVLGTLGPISAAEQVCEWAYHDLEHVRQLIALLEHGLHPGIGPFRAEYRRPFDGPAAPAS